MDNHYPNKKRKRIIEKNSNELVTIENKKAKTNINTNIDTNINININTNVDIGANIDIRKTSILPIYLNSW